MTPTNSAQVVSSTGMTIAIAVTILIIMPVVPKPADLEPQFGEKAVILFGVVDKEAMRHSQARVRTSKQDENAEVAGESGSIDSD